MTARTVTGVVERSGNIPIVGARISADLYAGVDGVPAYATTDMQAGATGTMTDATGRWTLTLEPNSTIQPSGSVYRITVGVPDSAPIVYWVSVPDTSGSHEAMDILAEQPGGLPSEALAGHAASSQTHGVTGDIVGTGNTQTLTNKTLTAPRLTSGSPGDIQRRSVIDVREFGTVGDGQAIQDAVDYVLGVGNPTTTARAATAAVYMPSARWEFDTPLRVLSAIDFTMYGDGASTKLAAASASMDSVVDLNGVAYCNFRDFMITGGGTAWATRGLWLRWNGYYRSTTYNNFSNIRVRDLKCVSGFELGDTDNAGVQVDTDLWVGCGAHLQWSAGETTWWQNGFLVGDGTAANNLIHTFVGTSVEHAARGIYVAHSQAAVLGGQFTANGTDFHVEGTIGYSRFAGLRSEGAGRLLNSPGATTFPGHVTLEDITWYPNAVESDGFFVRWGNGGHLAMRNLSVQPSSTTLRVEGFGQAPYTIEISGCSMKTAAASVASLNGYGRVELRNYYQVNDSLAVIAATNSLDLP